MRNPHHVLPHRSDRRLRQGAALLIPKVTAVLRRMAADDGTLKKVQAQALKEYRSQCD
ncbi:MAG: hypothetical protein K2X79_06250 [Burkholderiaceae bacterium]|nr:hypothetical protein [Burkholderiaceae bacterium]